MAASHHIHVPLPPRLVSQVTGYLPPGSSGGGTGHGIAGPDAPEYPNLSHTNTCDSLPGQPALSTVVY